MANRTKAEKWRSEETDKFFMALQVFGTDFSMIEKLFADRSREQIKVIAYWNLISLQNKFRKEERRNKAHIDKILANKERLTFKDFQAKFGPVDLKQDQD